MLRRHQARRPEHRESKDGGGGLDEGGARLSLASDRQLSASQPISGVGGGREGSIRSWGGGGMVVDAEIVGIDRQSGRLRAFQVLSPESYILYPSL